MFTYTFIQITATQTAEIVDVAKDLIGNLMPIIAIFIAVSLGVYVINALIHRNK